MASCSFSTLLERVTACGLSSYYPGHVEVVSLKERTRHISRHLQLHGLSADKAVDSEFKLLLAGNVIAFCSGITVFHNFGHRYFMALGVPQSRFCRVAPLPCPRAPGGLGVAGMVQW